MTVSVPRLPGFGDTIDQVRAPTAPGGRKAVPPISAFGSTAPGRASTARDGHKFLQGVDLEETMDGLQDMSGQIASVIEKRLLRDIDFFRACDADGSGAISHAEFARVLRDEMGVNTSQQFMEQIALGFDKDKSGFIEYEELHEMLMRQEKVSVYVTPRRWLKLAARLNSYRLLQNVAHRRPLHVEKSQVGLGRRANLSVYAMLAGEQCHSGTCRPSNKLAIVAHPLHDGQFQDTADQRAAYSLLHRALVEADWNVLAFEANTLAADGDGEAETAKLKAIMTHIAGHRKLRYCKVALLTQGVGGAAAIRYASDASPGSDDLLSRLCCLSVSQPSGDPALLAQVELEAAPRCRVPIFLSHLDDKAHDALPRVISTILRARGVDTESLAVPRHAIPTYGTGRRFQAERLFGSNPEGLIQFIDTAASKMAQVR